MASDTHDEATKLTVKAPPGSLGLSFVRQGPSIFVTAREDSPLASQIVGKMMLVTVDGIDVSDLDHDNVAELLLSRADSERLLVFAVDPAADPTKRITKVVAVPLLGFKKVRAPPGKLGVTFKYFTKGEKISKSHEVTQSGLFVTAAVNSPPALTMDRVGGYYRVHSVEGRPLTGNVESEQAKKELCNQAAQLLISRADHERSLVLFRGSISQLGAEMQMTSRGTIEVTQIASTSPLLAIASVGAEILEVDGATDGLNALLCGVYEKTFAVLKLSTPPLAQMRMEYIHFIPIDFQSGKVTAASAFDRLQSFGLFEDDVAGASNLSEGRYETMPMMQIRMNQFLVTSGLKVISVETASIDGSIARVNSGRYRSGGGDRAEWVYQTFRVWYNALDPANRLPHVVRAIQEQKDLADATIKEAKEGCVVM